MFSDGKLPFQFSVYFRAVQVGLPFFGLSEPPLQIFIVEWVGRVVGDYFHVVFRLSLYTCSSAFALLVLRS